MVDAGRSAVAGRQLATARRDVPRGPRLGADRRAPISHHEYGGSRQPRARQRLFQFHQGDQRQRALSPFGQRAWAAPAFSRWRGQRRAGTEARGARRLVRAARLRLQGVPRQRLVARQPRVPLLRARDVRRRGLRPSGHRMDHPAAGIGAFASLRRRYSVFARLADGFAGQRLAGGGLFPQALFLSSREAPMLRRLLIFWLTLSVLGRPALADEPSVDQLIEAGHYKRARAKLSSAGQPANAAEADRLSRIALVFGELDRAFQLSERATSLAPKNARYRVQLAMAAGARAMRAGLFKAVSLGRRMKEELEKALDLDEKNVEALSTLVLFHLKAPGFLGAHPEEAREITAELQRLDPVRGFLAQAQIAREDKKLDQLPGLYTRVAESRPKDYAAQVAAASIDPTRAAGHARLAEALAGSHRWAELDEALAEAERNVPDNYLPNFAVGVLLLNQGQELARAEACLRKYLSQEPEGGTPSRAIGRWRLGQALEKLGRKREAMSELEAALKEQPDLKEAKKDLERLK